MMTQKIATLCALAGLAGAPLSAATIEERLGELEKQVQKLAAENASLKKELGYTKEGAAPVLVTPAGKVKKFSIGGLLQGNAEFGEAPDARWNGINDRFLVRRARLNASAVFAEDFTAKVEIEFGSGTLATGTGYRAQMTDGFVQWNKYPEAVVRVGQFKTPFGYEQLAADPKIFTVERSLPNDRLTVGRQIGAALSGDVLEKRLSYSVGAFNGTGVNTNTNDNDDMMWVGRLSGVVHEGKLGDTKVKLGLGTNAYTSEDKGSSLTGRREGLGFDTQLSVGPVEVWAEWLEVRNKPVVGLHTKASGYSLLGLWRVSPSFQGVLRFESYDSNTSTLNTTTDVWTLGFNYLIKADDLKFSVNYLFGDQPGSANDGDRLLARMQVVF